MEKININPEIRWKAFLRAQLRASFDLFHFGGYMNKSESSLGVEGRRNIAKRLKTDSKIRTIVDHARIEELLNLETGERGPSARVLQKPNTFTHPKISLDASESLHPWARDHLFANAWHEIVHAQSKDKLNRNDFILAHAVGEYFILAQYPISFSKSRLLPENIAKLIEKSFVRGTKESVIKKYGGNYRNVEYSAAFPSGESFAYLGRILARSAIKLEGQLGISGIGLVFIREMSKGGSIELVAERIKRRKLFYTRELIAWYKRHPSVKRYLLNSKAIVTLSHPATQRKFKMVKTMRAKLQKKNKPHKTLRKK
jgi:hypothetical protein